jgi:hypothetical protein
MKKSALRLLFLCLCYSSVVFGQGGITKDYKVITTAVPFLSISPDSKSAALGDAGVASTPDANAIFWNTSKLAFVENKFGASVSYAPWLRDLVQDMGLINAFGYYKISDKQTLTAGMTYFNQGLIEFTTNTAQPAGSFQSREMSFMAGIAQKLSSDFSMGLNAKFINSNLVGNNVINGQAGRPGRTAAFDLGLYYNKNRPGDADVEKSTDIAYGLVLQNLGGKVNYGFGQYFIPANLKIGTQIVRRIDLHNRFTFLVDFNKLLVPTPDTNGMVDPTQSVFSSMFSSFNDAPGGMREELSEVMASVGLEYSYDDLIAFRTGYFHESGDKGGRQYFTTGFGVKLKDLYNIDLAYLIPTKQGNPLANTWRISLNFSIPSKMLRSSVVNGIDEE